MSGILDFELGAETLERSKVDLAVAGFFVDQQPLRGGAGRVDWRLCGLVSDQILAERIHGKRGEAILIPSSGQMRANNIMLVGLGSRSKYKLTGVTKVVEDVVARAVKLACPSLAMAPLGLAGDEYPRCAEAILAGAVAGFGASESSIRIRMVLPQAEINRSAQATEAAIGALSPERLRFKRPGAQSASSRATPHGAAMPKPGPR